MVHLKEPINSSRRKDVGDVYSHLSVTMSKTAPNLDV